MPSVNIQYIAYSKNSFYILEINFLKRASNQLYEVKNNFKKSSLTHQSVLLQH